jgi:ATP-dependent helicase/nuclease subunit A
MAETPQRKVKARGQAEATAAIVGTICHSVLATEGITADGLRALVDKHGFAAAPELPDKDRSAACARAYEILSKYLSSDLYKRLTAMKIIGKEVPFLLEEDSKIISGRIDTIFEDQSDLLVIDYKTDRDAQDLLIRYKIQLDIYAHAVSKAFPGRNVKGALVWLPGAQLLTQS